MSTKRIIAVLDGSRILTKEANRRAIRNMKRRYAGEQAIKSLSAKGLLPGERTSHR